MATTSIVPCPCMLSPGPKGVELRGVHFDFFSDASQMNGEMAGNGQVVAPHVQWIRNQNAFPNGLVPQKPSQGLAGTFDATSASH